MGRGHKIVLDGVNLAIAPGDKIGLLGRNGAGKTTLMRTVMGLLAADDGRLAFLDHDLRAEPAMRRAALGIGYMPEDRRLVPDLDVEENVLVPVWATRSGDADQRLAFVYELLPEVAEFRDRRPSQLSGGQQKLVALARALMAGTKLLLLDEPFEGVAPVLAQRLAGAIGKLRTTGVAVLLSESDYVHSETLVDKLYVIERGVVTRGGPDEGEDQ
jgi:branched-chain amino acid transport system ATP-binding protein